MPPTASLDSSIRAPLRDLSGAVSCDAVTALVTWHLQSSRAEPGIQSIFGRAVRFSSFWLAVVAIPLRIRLVAFVVIMLTVPRDAAIRYSQFQRPLQTETDYGIFSIVTLLSTLSH